ncbi:MAG: CehA/McbA family metallohydrolase, partial [Bryobacteraceae bacterium]
MVFRCLVAVTAVAALMSTPAPEKRWYKGNLHTHTLRSDGDSSPEDVAAWYKSHDYQFLVLSDHNVLTAVGELNEAMAEKEKFILISGEEVTSSFENRPVHINAYNLSRLVDPLKAESMAETIQKNVDAIRAAKALPSVNHPNFHWAMTSADLLAVENLNMFEVYNGHPQVYNLGGGGSESLGQMWDALLSAGRTIYGIAVDDAHHFKIIDKQKSNPGRGWIVVRAAELSTSAVASAIEAGDFYASNGVELSGVKAGKKHLRIVNKPRGDAKYTTLFIGQGGKVLDKSFDLTP